MQGSGGVYLIDNHADTALMTLRYALRDADIAVAEKPFDAAGRHFGAGAWIVRKVDNAAFSTKIAELGLDAYAVAAAPDVAAHRIGAPRIALMHTWLTTQTEGWWRMAFDKLGVPFAYISTQTVAREDNLRNKYDVILFAPLDMGDAPGGAGISQLIVNGLPLWGNPMPWKKTALTPNMNIDQTDDIRPGLGAEGLAHLRRFVEQGGLFLAAGNVTKFAIDSGLAPGVSVTPPKDLKVVGSVLKGIVVDDDESGELRLWQGSGHVQRGRPVVQTEQPAHRRRWSAEREGLQASDRPRRPARCRHAGRPRRRRRRRTAGTEAVGGDAVERRPDRIRTCFFRTW